MHYVERILENSLLSSCLENSRQAVAMVATVALLTAFQLQLLPFFSPLFVADKTIWPVVHHGFWLFVALSTAFALSRRDLPLILLVGALGALTLAYPIDAISKSFIGALTFLVCACALARAAGAIKVLQLSAAVTAISACICLVDILFVHGLSDTPGRAAGLSVNPNIAALGLLLGAMASYWTVPKKWVGYFLALIGAAIFVTLSKSILIVYLAIFGAVLAVRIRRRKPLPRLAGAAVLTIGLVAWIGLALTLNDRFMGSASNAFHLLGGALPAFEAARTSIAAAAAARRDGASAHQVMIEELSRGAENEGDINAARRDGASADQIMIEELSRRAENEGGINSISARGLLMERAWIAYRDGPLFGIGIGLAHAFHPHNSFLLFAIAFGPVGWLIPLGFIALARKNIPLVLATFAAAMVSHDIFLQPALLFPLALGAAADEATSKAKIGSSGRQSYR
jgi:hypothetical protein